MCISEHLTPPHPQNDADWSPNPPENDDGLKIKNKKETPTRLNTFNLATQMREISELKPERVSEVGGAGVTLQAGGTDGRRARFVSYNQRRVR